MESHIIFYIIYFHVLWFKYDIIYYYYSYIKNYKKFTKLKFINKIAVLIFFTD